MAQTPKKKLDLDALLIQVVTYLSENDPSSLSFSKLAKLTSVPRTTLYYYFGSSMQKLQKEAIRHGIKLFFGFFNAEPQPHSGETWDDYQRMRFDHTSTLVERFPWAPFMYFRYIRDRGSLGETMREWESAYVKNFAENWKKINKTSIDPLNVKLLGAIKMGLLFGIASDPDLRRNRQLCLDLVIRISKEILLMRKSSS